MGASVVLLVSIVLSAAGSESEFDAADRDAIQEAVYRDMLKPLDSGDIAFLEVEEQADPSDALIAKLADMKLRLRKASQARTIPWHETQGWSHVDRKTGEPGVMITAKGIKRLAIDRARVGGFYSKNYTNGHYDTYFVAKVNGRWIVAKKTQHFEF